MFKKILAVTAMLLATAAYAAVDANKGGAADFDALKGVGPAMSKRIVDARQQGEFKDWSDLMQRVKGMKDKTATKLSGEGLTVHGQAFKGGATTRSAKSETRAAKPAVAAAK